MKKGIFILSFTGLLFSGCEKKYERPDQYNVDLFENERGTNKAYVMNNVEAFEASTLVLGTSDLTIADSSKGRGKSFFIYKVKSATVLKTTRDSVVNFPLKFISNQKLQFKKENNDSVYVYLETLKGFKMIGEKLNIKYQWLKAAPIYKMEKKAK